ncbi:MAG: RidA family protein [Planctomycetota bacterium]
MERINIGTGTVWEDRVGYSRAVRTGPLVVVAGTTAVDEQSNSVAPGDAYAQTVFILEKIAAALERAGASLSDVVRTRTYIVSIDDQEHVGRAHHEAFAEVRPAATMIEISGLVRPELVVEIEVEAWVGDA